MNERMNELAEQAKELAEQAFREDNAKRFTVMEKFAELIVRECIDCLKPLSRNHSMVGAAQDTIKEHFGVEE